MLSNFCCTTQTGGNRSKGNESAEVELIPKMSENAGARSRKIRGSWFRCDIWNTKTLRPFKQTSLLDDEIQFRDLVSKEEQTHSLGCSKLEAFRHRIMQQCNI